MFATKRQVGLHDLEAARLKNGRQQLGAGEVIELHRRAFLRPVDSLIRDAAVGLEVAHGLHRLLPEGDALIIGEDEYGGASHLPHVAHHDRESTQRLQELASKEWADSVTGN